MNCPSGDEAISLTDKGTWDVAAAPVTDPVLLHLAGVVAILVKHSSRRAKREILKAIDDQEAATP